VLFSVELVIGNTGWSADLSHTFAVSGHRGTKRRPAHAFVTQQLDVWDKNVSRRRLCPTVQLISATVWQTGGWRGSGGRRETPGTASSSACWRRLARLQDRVPEGCRPGAVTACVLWPPVRWLTV